MASALWAVLAAGCGPAEPCGNGRLDPGEVCDDGNRRGGDGCSADCRSNETCGNGVVDAAAGEVCDDGNAHACGSCSADCRQAQPMLAASGAINAIHGAQIRDSETFVLGDGLNPAITFEFDKNSSLSSPSHVAVPFNEASRATLVASNIAEAILAQRAQGRLRVAAVATSAQVALTHDRAGASGNLPLVENVADPSFTVAGMSGGAGANCPAGIGCAADTDCAPSLTCSLATRTCVPS